LIIWGEFVSKWVKQKVLMIVKTYPQPSRTYQETVCTAGITDKGDWIRLYPIKFRDLQNEQQFKKYTWIEVETIRPRNDKRPESFKVNDESIRIIRHVPPKEGLKERMDLILPHVKGSLEDIIDDQSNLGTSLGIFKPAQVTDLIITETDRDWTNEQKALLSQMSIFELNNPKKILEKVPWKFQFKFRCNDSRCNGHLMTITDWEIYQTYRNFHRLYKNEDKALEQLKNKWLGLFNTPEKDTYFIVGTVHRYKKFIIIGYFTCPHYDYEQLRFC